jgi:negative regulator of flagellin synthesis FlgM
MIINNNGMLDSANLKNARSTNPKVQADAKPQTGGPSAKPAAGNAGDQVILSPQARNLGGLQSKIDTLPDVDMDKVATIKRAIAEGRFEINPERIAENMLNQEKLLG